jgi:predicted nucleic acid-binding protein
MSGFLLDTNVPSELVRPLPEPKVRTWVAAQNLDTLFISTVSFGELRKGVVLLSPGKRMTLRLLENIERLQKFSPCCADFLSEEL